MEVTVITSMDPGPVAVELAANLTKDLPNVNSLIFSPCAHLEREDDFKRTGCWDPATGTIWIDLVQCIKQIHLIKSGVFLIPTVWNNIIDAIFHETRHAWQYYVHKIDPSTMLTQPQIDLLESDAINWTLDQTINWFTKNTTPKLTHMGDVGEQLKLILNEEYAAQNTFTEEEIKVIGTKAAALFGIFVNLSEPAFNVGSTELLQDRITNGEFGIMINGVPYLTMEEIIGSHLHTVKSHTLETGGLYEGSR